MKLIIGLNANHFLFSKEKLKKLEHSLSLSRHVFRFVPRDFLHIKLLQLSDYDPGLIRELEKKLQQISIHHHEIQLKLCGLWAYPNQDEARVLWIGVQNSIALRSLQEEITESLLKTKDNWADHQFKPTLPILRFRNHHNVSDMISPYKGMEFGKILFQSIVVLEMTKSGAFPEYRKLYEVHLSRIDKGLSITG